MTPTEELREALEKIEALSNAKHGEEELWRPRAYGEGRVDALMPIHKIAAEALARAAEGAQEGSEPQVEAVALAIQDADNTGRGDMEGAANGLHDDVSDWGAYVARAAIRAMLAAAPPPPLDRAGGGAVEGEGA